MEQRLTAQASYLLRSRLGRRVALATFLAIVGVEALILVPSYLKHRKDLLQGLTDTAHTAALAAFAHMAHASPRDLQLAGRLLLRVEPVTGGALYGHDGAQVARFGEAPVSLPPFRAAGPAGRLLADDSRFEVALPAGQVGTPFSIVLRLDATSIGTEMLAYVQRIAALTLVISLTLTAVTLFVLNWLVLRPVLRLRNSLVAARGDVRQAERYVPALWRQDEIGDMIRALQVLLRQVARARHQDLSASEQRFRDFAASASDFFWEMDENLRFSYFSSNMSAITGVSEDNMLGLTREEAGNPGVDEQLFRDHLADLEAHRPFRNFVHPRMLEDGRQVYLAINGKPIHDAHDRFRGYRGTGSDITESMQAEQQLREAKRRAEDANHAKSNFLALMSHELRTPLNAILGFSEVIGAGMFGPIGDVRYVDYAGDIHRSGHHLLALIDDILDLSKIEAGRFDLNLRDVDVPAVVEESVGLVRGEAEKKQLILQLDVDGELPPLRADPRALQQILSNLLSNAVKFTPEGGRVGISAGVLDGALRLQISDSGIGIPDADIDRVLEPFSQVDSGYARRFQGTGLGLSIVRALVELHGGRLQLHSVVGEGTRATVTLPDERLQAGDRHPAPADAAEASGEPSEVSLARR